MEKGLEGGYLEDKAAAPLMPETGERKQKIRAAAFADAEAYLKDSFAETGQSMPAGYRAPADAVISRSAEALAEGRITADEIIVYQSYFLDRCAAGTHPLVN